MRNVVISAVYWLVLSGCSTTFWTSNIDKQNDSRNFAGQPALLVTQPALCNDYPVEVKRGPDGSTRSVEFLDVWMLEKRPDRCPSAAASGTESSRKRPFWRFW